MSSSFSSIDTVGPFTSLDSLILPELLAKTETGKVKNSVFPFGDTEYFLGLAWLCLLCVCVCVCVCVCECVCAGKVHRTLRSFWWTCRGASSSWSSVPIVVSVWVTVTVLKYYIFIFLLCGFLIIPLGR
jgi:hypothetical protein